MNSYSYSWPEGIGLLPNRTRVIIIYPTVDPQVVVVPILSSIFIFPIIVFLVICCLRKMAARRRQLARLAQRDDGWNERSCASIVQRSPPLSYSGEKYGDCEGTTTVELMTPDGPPDSHHENESLVNSPTSNIQRLHLLNRPSYLPEYFIPVLQPSDIP